MTEDATLLRTPLNAVHSRLGARMMPFAGWDMPVQYAGILAEHAAVRAAAGLFDISHMGRVYVHGPEALAFLQHVTTNDVGALHEHQAQYSLLCRADGTTLDDILVYRLPEHFLVVVNAGNRERDLAFLRERLRPGVTLTDDTANTAMLAIQGPQAIAIVQAITQEDLGTLRRYHIRLGDVANVDAMLARTGYTGEDGLELIVAADRAEDVWDAVLAAGRSHGLQPAGLGARDTLRTEAGLPLYGHELTDDTNPLEAGLGHFVALEKSDWLAGAALRRIAAVPLPRRLAGLQLESRIPARAGSLLFAGDQQVGQVTSGTFAPTLQKSVALAYLNAGNAEPGSRVDVEIRGQRYPATVVALPFYRRPRRRAR
ncbi:MAG TPA: glycine cleavage system aminomethyltransferase GcvT [Chloroflexota bacterium]|jgi:aminomethyltransferase|nr:glycine cleavage system aminomethyltransferase GcvT [Chloroflexota bacterium]